MAISQVVCAKANGSLYNILPPNVSNESGGNGGSVTGAYGDLLDKTIISRTNTTIFGSVVIDNNVADKAVDSDVFASDNERPIAQKTYSILQSAAGYPRGIRGIHLSER